MIKVSVIIPVYNSEKYIEKAILSVINQELKDTQLIIIDDGSTDKSLEICTELSNKYNNMEIYTQKNKGPGAARNIGLKHAKGQYITFLDSDDYIPEKVFKKVYGYLHKNKADIFVGNILCFDDVRTWHLPYMNKIFNKKNELTIKTFKNIPEVNQSPSVCNKWFKSEMIRKNSILFDEVLKVGEDLLFTQKCFVHSNLIALKNIDIYSYRLVNKDSLIKKADLNFFYELLNCNKKLNEIYDNKIIQKEVIIKRQLEFWIDSIFLKIKKLDKSDIESLVNISIDIFQLNKDIKIDRIDFRSLERYFLVKLLKDGQVEQAIKFIENILLEDCEKELIVKNNKHYSYLVKIFGSYNELLEIEPVIESKVENSYVENEQLIIRGYSFIRGLNIEESKTIRRTLVLEGSKKENIIRTKIENDYRTDLTYIFREDKINYNWGGYKPISINLNELIDDEYEVYMEISIAGNIYKVPFEYRLAQIKNKLKVQYIQDNREIFCRFSDLKYLKIRVRKLDRVQLIKSKLRKIKRDLRYDLSLIKRKKYKSFLVLYLYRIIGWYLRKKEIWLMGERPDTAQDNTYYLYKYIVEEYPNINVRYVISTDSNNKECMKFENNLIKYGGILHSLYMLSSEYVINSYTIRNNMETREAKDIIKCYPELYKAKKIFLQHGVIGFSRVNHSLHKNITDYDLFIVSSEYEKKHIISEYGYKDEEVPVTGLARWDTLNNNYKKKILLMPTWRSWIRSEEELLESEYFKKYIEFLMSDELERFLKENNYELTFYPHYQIQRLISKLEMKFNKNITLIHQGEISVQELINDHEILITDYSTVSYDFAYMKKQIIFYQFDYNEFYSKHYNKGILNDETDLFGVRICNKNELICSIKQVLNEKRRQDKAEKYICRELKPHRDKIMKEIIRVY